MLNKSLVGLAALTAVSTLSALGISEESCSRVEGFYATWDGVLGGALPVEDIDTSRLTHVLVAFAMPQADGSIDTSEPDAIIDELVAKACHQAAERTRRATPQRAAANTRRRRVARTAGSL